MRTGCSADIPTSCRTARLGGLYAVMGMVLVLGATSTIFGASAEKQEAVIPGSKSSGMPVPQSKNRDYATAKHSQESTASHRSDEADRISPLGEDRTEDVKESFKTSGFSEGYNAARHHDRTSLKGQSLAFKKGYLAGVNDRLADLMKRTTTGK